MKHKKVDMSRFGVNAAFLGGVLLTALLLTALLLSAIVSFGQVARQAQAQSIEVEIDPPPDPTPTPTPIEVEIDLPSDPTPTPTPTIISCPPGFTSVGTTTLPGNIIVHQCVMTEIEIVEADKPEDYAALEALYNATDGANWTNNTDWLSDKPLDEWYGISTIQGGNYAGRVSFVNLEENNLRGTIPAAIGDLSRAIFIDLSRNQLTGGIPKELSKITDLNRLHLFDNQLTGNIPPEFRNLKVIHFLYLQNNRLSGTLSTELTKIPPQSHLHLDVRNNAGICAPPDASFQAWLRSIGSYDGLTCARKPLRGPAYLSGILIELHDDEDGDHDEDEDGDHDEDEHGDHDEDEHGDHDEDEHGDHDEDEHGDHDEDEHDEEDEHDDHEFGVLLTWTPGSNPYWVKQTVMRREVGARAAQWTTFDVAASESEYTDESAQPCKRYIYRVRGVDSYGGGVSSNSVELSVPADECLPGVPQNLTLTAGNRWIVVRWDAPEYGGTPPFNGYSISFREAEYSIAEGPGEFTTLWHDDLSINAITIDYRLTNNKRYEVYVAAVNNRYGDMWTGTAAGPEKVRIPPNLGSTLPPYPERQPSEPRNLALAAGDGEITVSWDAPSRLRNSRARYLVEYRKAGAGRWIEEGLESSPATIKYLERGRTYEVRVTVFDTYGDATAGPERVTTLGGDGPDAMRPPTAPRGLQLTPGDGQISVSWRVPSDIGESDDWLGYVVEVRERGESEWFDWGFYESTSAIIDDLENGTTYEVRVIAFNLWDETATRPKTATPNKEQDPGPQPPSSSNNEGGKGNIGGQGGPDEQDEKEEEEQHEQDEEEPEGRVPGAPTNLRAVQSGEWIDVSWSEPSDRGEPGLHGYELQYRARNSQGWLSWITVETIRTSSRGRVFDDTPFLEYQYKVRALNGAGKSSLSATVSVAVTDPVP